MSLTSCEGALDDILGEWSRPTPGSSTGGAVTSIDLDADEMKLAAGDKGQLTATVAPDNATDKTVTWSSDKEEIATVDANGLVTAVAMGTAIITAKAGDKTATCEVTVTPGLATPLTVEAITAGTITVDSPMSGMQFSKNGGAKETMTSTTEIPVEIGDKVAFYGDGTSITSYSGTMIKGGTADIKVYGNIMSLVDETGFATNTELQQNFAFANLFQENVNLIDASGLLLPATTLKTRCYQSMFIDCTNLAAAPKELPATTLADRCYRYMFGGCKALTTAPKLPAENLATNCYERMFDNCSSLTTAYVKAAYTDTGACTNMFNGCLAAGTKTLHTTTTNKGSWDTVMPSAWAGWTAVDDWTD